MVVPSVGHWCGFDHAGGFLNVILKLGGDSVTVCFIVIFHSDVICIL